MSASEPPPELAGARAASAVPEVATDPGSVPDPLPVAGPVSDSGLAAAALAVREPDAACEAAEAAADPDADPSDASDASDDVEDDGTVRHQLTVTFEHSASRLDVYLTAQLAAPRTLVQRLIDSELVTIDDRPAKKAGQKLRAGEVIVALVPRPAPLEVVAEDLPLPILYQDLQLVIVEKPAGMVVHPSAGHSHGTMVNALLFHCRDLSGIGGVLRPGIVHRLDKDTSGVMMVSKNDLTHAYLAAELARKSAGGVSSVRREYLAIASPPPSSSRGTYRTLYGRHPSHRHRFSSKVTRGKTAVTHWEVVERFAGAALLAVRLETGRTHQIRVHAADHGWPLLGDVVYGRRPADPLLAQLAAELGRQALHAHVLAFAHPQTGEMLEFTSPLPPDLQRVMDRLRAG
jgi:23S rRNA pseudouridine1911/1915/1917 synthase